MLSVRQVAEQIGISTDRVRALIHARRLRAHNLSAGVTPRYAIEAEDLRRFLDASVAGVLPGPEPSPVKRQAREPAAEALEFIDRALARRKRAG